MSHHKKTYFIKHHFPLYSLAAQVEVNYLMLIICSFIYLFVAFKPPCRCLCHVTQGQTTGMQGSDVYCGRQAMWQT